MSNVYPAGSLITASVPAVTSISTIGSATITGSYSIPSGIVFGGQPAESYLYNCQQVKDIIHSLTGFYDMLTHGTDEENLLLLESISKKLLRAKTTINDSIDMIERKKSVNLK